MTYVGTPGALSHGVMFNKVATAVSLASLFAGAGCTNTLNGGPSDDGTTDVDTAEDEQRALLIDNYVRGIDPWGVEEELVIEGQAGQQETSGDYVCVTTNYSETRQYDKIVAYGANSNAMWPGAVLRGDSVETGLFTPVGIERSPLTFSVSLPGLAGASSATLENPRLSSYREALATILEDDIDGATPANVYAEIEEVHSEEQLAIALGAQVTWGTGSVAASFNFSDTEKRSRYVVKFTQSYFTVDVDTPEFPSDFLSKNVDVADVEQHWWQGNAPVYVSSVTYGRSVLFMFESNYSLEEMRAALDFVYNAGVSVSGDVSVTYREMLEETNMTAYVLGGSAEDAVQAIDNFDALKDFIAEGGNFSKESPGAPIAYKLAYLADNSPARFSMTDDYEVEECYRVTQKLAVVLESIRVVNVNGGEGGNNLELFGSIRAIGDDTKTLFSRGRGSYVQIDEGETWPNSGMIAEDVITVTPEEGENITLSVNFSEDDWLDTDHYSGSLTLPFELGWRKSAVVYVGGNVDIEVRFRLQPI